jgi:hypothetical protein
MFPILAVLVYLLAIGIPIFLLYWFRSQTWYWHLLSVVAALGLGMTPTPSGWNGAGFDLVFGFLFVLLLVWGVGGLVLFGPRQEKHA